MEKKILIEKVESTPLSYKVDEDSKFLGILEGIAADSNEKTRNGRRYPIELWRNVENSPEFKEAMETQTCFGEADHPFDERVDTSIKEVAIVLLSFDIGNDGKVYCRFGILDTPNGRLLKSILDSGCQIGVSSRGIGEEVTKNGEVIIDPDSYVFYGFDAVVMPAVVSARPTMTEATDASNPGLKSLSESFNREIESASTKTELESMMRLAEKINLPDTDSIKESINTKLESLSGGENISSKLESDLGILAQENENLKSEIASLKSELSAKNIRINEDRGLIKKMRNNSRDLSKSLRESMVKVSSLTEEVSRKDSTIQKLRESLNMNRNQNKRLRESLNDSDKNNKLLENRISDSSSRILSKDSEISRLRKMNKALESRISQKEKDVSSVQEAIKSKDSELSRVNKVLRESKQKISTVLTRYVAVRCAQENLDKDSIIESLPKNYSMDDVDKIVKEASNRRDRLNKVPVILPPRKAVITEGYPTNPETKELEQTESFLMGVLTTN